MTAVLSSKTYSLSLKDLVVLAGVPAEEYIVSVKISSLDAGILEVVTSPTKPRDKPFLGGYTK